MSAIDLYPGQYGTIAWANQEIEEGNRLLKQGSDRHMRVAGWIFQESQHRGLSLSTTVKQLVDEGLNVNYKTAQRWISGLDEYRQIREGKRANPSDQAKWNRKSREELHISHGEKCVVQAADNILSAKNETPRSDSTEEEYSVATEDTSLLLDAEVIDEKGFSMPVDIGEAARRLDAVSTKDAVVEGLKEKVRSLESEVKDLSEGREEDTTLILDLESEVHRYQVMAEEVPGEYGVIVTDENRHMFKAAAIKNIFGRDTAMMNLAEYLKYMDSVDKRLAAIVKEREQWEVERERLERRLKKVELERDNLALEQHSVGSGSWWQVLGVAESASEVDVKAAYRRLLRFWHPDTCKRSDAKEATQRLNDAWSAYESRDQLRDSSGKLYFINVHDFEEYVRLNGLPRAGFQIFNGTGFDIKKYKKMGVTFN